MQNLEQEFAETEKREKARVVRAPKEGGKMGMLVALAKQRADELRTNLERVVKERDDAQSRLKELESMLTTFKEEYNPNFNDEGVKRAVRAWEDYAARDKPTEDLAIERDLKEVLKDDSENGLTWTDWEHEESDADVCEFSLRFILRSTKRERVGLSHPREPNSRLRMQKFGQYRQQRSRKVLQALDKPTYWRPC